MTPNTTSHTMKTLVVLYALASIAIAAPALPEEPVDGTQPLQNTFKDLITREKKSPLEDSHSNLNTEATNNFESEATAAARSIALKKPLIVKNKHGYRLYRDSEEEKALSDDSHQTCGRQIRFKLCDEDSKFRGMMRSPAHENIPTSEDDMKHSIKMAKETVEILQRDLKKMEHDVATKMVPGNAESEELHEEIEVARQALEHIHKNFGNLESMSLHTTTTRASDAMPDVHLMMANTEEERMAQWKKAIDNINRNVEIARNIEDSFKSVQEPSLRLDEDTASKPQQKFEENIGSHKSLGDHLQMRSLENLNHDVEEKSDEKEPSCKVTNEHFAGHHARLENHVEEDMNPSASTNTEIQIDNLNKKDALRSESLTNQEVAKRKSDETMTDTTLETIDEPNQEKKSELTIKAVEQAETKLDSDTPMFSKNSENMFDSVIAPTMVMNIDEPSANQKNVEEKWTDDQLHHSADEMKSTMNLLAKSVESAGQMMETESKPKFTEDNSEVTMIMEQPEATPNSQIELKNINGPAMKSTEQLEGKDSHLDTEQDENLMFVKSVEHALHNHQENIEKLDRNQLAHIENLAQMKAAENLRHEMHDPTHWAHENRHMERLSSMKAPEELMNEFHDRDHLKHMNFNENHHMQGEIDSASEFGMTDQSQFHSGNFHHNHNMRGMRPNFHNGMRDVMEGHGSENMFRWKPTHETSRAAYGGGGLATTGAVGVFPNANAGGCGIPLLLSCSPSVVSGSLAKAHPAASGAYPAPAYRTEDDFSFHNKRDIKKNNDILASNVLRSPSIIKQKSKTMLQNKLESKL